jgi:hypothetical protein
MAQDNPQEARLRKSYSHEKGPGSQKKRQACGENSKKHATSNEDLCRTRKTD